MYAHANRVIKVTNIAGEKSPAFSYLVHDRVIEEIAFVLRARKERADKEIGPFLGFYGVCVEKGKGGGLLMTATDGCRIHQAQFECLENVVHGVRWLRNGSPTVYDCYEMKTLGTGGGRSFVFEQMVQVDDMGFPPWRKATCWNPPSAVTAAKFAFEFYEKNPNWTISQLISVLQYEYIRVRLAESNVKHWNWQHARLFAQSLSIDFLYDLFTYGRKDTWCMLSLCRPEEETLDPVFFVSQHRATYTRLRAAIMPILGTVPSIQGRLDSIPS